MNSTNRIGRNSRQKNTDGRRKCKLGKRDYLHRSVKVTNFVKSRAIASAPRTQNYAEQRGLGFETVKDLPKKNIPLPVVKYNAPYIEVILPLTMQEAKTMYSDLTEKEIKVLEFIRMSGDASSVDIQERFGFEQKPALRIITKLREKGYISSIGKARNTRYKAI